MIGREIRLMARLGVGVVRVEFPWPLIERRQGTFSWSRTDTIVNDANQYHLQLQPVLVYTPAWAGPGFTQAPSDTASWSSFVRAVVHRYRNSIHYWELWNEPDAAYWMNGSQAYVQDILIPGSAAVKAVDPSARVLLGAPYFADTAYLNDIYRYGGGSSFDIIGFHEYANVLNANAVQQDVNAVQGVLDSHNESTKPIWIGEYGYNEPSETTDDTDHMTAMRIMLQQVTGYREAIWYNLRDDDAMTCCPPQSIKDAHWGLVQRDDHTLKRGFTAMRKLIQLLPPPL
jgi:beta-glucosidase/6-phospho-beta-glucosidase/beta-galactosidase